MLTSATISLRPAERHVHTVFTLYATLRECLKDIQLLADEPSCSYLEGTCSACFLGLQKFGAGRRPLFRWFYGIQFSVEHEEDVEPKVKEILKRLSCFEVVHQESDGHQGFLDRYQARFESMRRSGAWDQAHPWFECVLPLQRAPEFIAELLAMLPPTFGDGHRLFSINGASNPRYLQLPVGEDNTSLAVAVLPTGVPDSSLGTALEFVQHATELVHRCGGKRYLSGWLGTPDTAFWQRHYGGLYGEWEATKRSLDPNDVLTSQLFSA
ncbi:MAG: hypothetical protein ABI895_18110 [Deltaproteobacteria bacterium]